jgi:hypothetical protein
MVSSPELSNYGTLIADIAAPRAPYLSGMGLAIGLGDSQRFPVFVTPDG